MLLLLKFASSHLIVRFVLQPDLHAHVKVSGSRWSAARLILAHTCLFLMLSALLVFIPKPSPIVATAHLFYMLGLTGILHLLIDAAVLLPFFSTWQGITLSQVAHAGAILAGVSAFGAVPGLSWRWFLRICDTPHSYGLVIAYVISLGSGAVIVPLVTGGLSTESQPGIKNAGRYIGILERLLLTTLVIYCPKLDATAVGLIFSAKSVARFPEFKKQSFAEYYLVGTLVSFLVAIAAGLLVRIYL